MIVAVLAAGWSLSGCGGGAALQNESPQNRSRLQDASVSARMDSSKVLEESRPDPADSLYRVARKLDRDGEHQKAYLLYHKALQVNPDHYRSWYRAGRIMKRFDKLDAAVSAYMKALNINPKYAPAYHSLGIILHRQGDLKGAEQSYRRALVLWPSHAASWRNLGRVLFEKKNMKGAVAAFQQAVLKNPEDQQSLEILGLILAKQGELEKAKHYLTKSFMLNPRSRKTVGGLAWVNQQLGEDPQNIPELVLEFGPIEEWEPDGSDAQTDYERGVELMRKGFHAKAVEFFQAALSTGVYSDELYGNLGYSQLQLGRLDAAVENLQRAIRNAWQPQAWYYLNLGFALSLKGDWKGAIRNYSLAIDTDPYYAKAHYNMGVMRLKINHPQSALRSLRKAAQLEPGDASTWLAMGQAYDLLEEYENAAGAYRKSLTLEPRQPDLYFTLADMYLEQGKPEEALATYKDLLALDPLSHAVLIAQGRARKRAKSLAMQVQPAEEPDSTQTESP
ncbi:tetratricopeptide repeat protein [bacterium]|nr:tetratricopeptide repeat protein [bacterium]